MHRLLLQASASRLASLSTDDLLWRPHGEPSSVETTLGPRLEGLGSVPALHVDFVRLAALAFFVDRTVPRPRMLRRVLDIEVAVSDPSVWEPQGERLATLLGLLTGDEWTISWRRGREPQLRQLAEPPAGDLCVLFSGGADSTCGAAVAHSEGRRPILVSHFDWRNIGGQQHKALTALETALGVDPSSVNWRFARIGTQVGSQAEFENEKSKRSRSLLFIALGAAVAATTGNDLWIAENGFTSLNPPLTAESLGALSTRTTHPAFVRGLVEVLRDVGLSVHVESRFAEMTKGQMFSAVATALGDVNRAGELLSATHSCGKPLQDIHREPDAPCGVCLGCLVRRGAFIAAGLRDDTAYIERMLTGAARRAWLTPKRHSVYQALQDRLEVGFEEEDILDLGLPDDYDLDAALQLLRDGLNELAQVRIS
jgi:7-cyano-7-deazaguanine synthase in queuosine biosynthesis